MTSPVAVIGAGLMGGGIAQLMAAAGKSVMLFEPIEAARTEAIRKIRDISSSIGDPIDCVDRITVTSDLRVAVQDANFVIEAAPEKTELKQDLFAKLVELAPQDAILSSNSSVIPVTTISANLSDADAARVVGVHFWNPPYLIPLVEIIEGERTATASIERAMALLREAGKETVHIKKDIVVGNRLQHSMWREALSLIAEGAISAADADTVIKKSFALRLPILGPLENADLVGIELIQDVHRVVFPELCNDTEPSPVLQKMLDEGTRGMRDNQGFYDWTPETADEKRRELTEHLLKVTRG